MDLSKKELRQLIYNKRKDLKSDLKTKWDSIIYKKLIENEFYKKSNYIFVYVSFDGEVDTHKLIEKALSDGKTIYVPKVISKKEGMEACRIKSLDDLEKGFYGILEPKPVCQVIDPLEIDLLVMPGVAFDKLNRRIGYGGGFYDRFIRRVTKNAKKIALSYTFQIFDSIPSDEFDEGVDLVITND